MTNNRTNNLITLLKKSTKATLYLPADFLDSNLIDSSISNILNNAITELTQDTDLTVDKELVDDEYMVTVSLKTEKEEESI